MPLFKKTARENREEKLGTLQLRDPSAFMEILIAPEKGL
jgi:hypothetical protein